MQIASGAPELQSGWPGTLLSGSPFAQKAKTLGLIPSAVGKDKTGPSQPRVGEHVEELDRLETLVIMSYTSQ